jgi:hypothetical protein
LSNTFTLQVTDSEASTFQVLTVASMKTTACWHVAPCSLVDIGRRFRDAYCLHNQDDCRTDDGGNKHLWNLGKSLRDYKARHARKHLRIKLQLESIPWPSTHYRRSWPSLEHKPEVRSLQLATLFAGLDVCTLRQWDSWVLSGTAYFIKENDKEVPWSFENEGCNRLQGEDRCAGSITMICNNCVAREHGSVPARRSMLLDLLTIDWTPSSESPGMYCRALNWMSTDVSEVRRRFWTSYSPPWELEIPRVNTRLTDITNGFGD